AVAVGGGKARAATGAGSARAESAPRAARYEISVQAVYDASGNPSLTANFSGPIHPRWSICTPADPSVCRPAPGSRAIGGASAALQVGATPVGTVFEATARYRGRAYEARTAPWQGTVRATGASQLSGSARYGARVTPDGASWVGGWQAVPSIGAEPGLARRGANFDYLSVEACRTQDARRCVTIASPYASPGARGGQAPPIGAWFTGWYLFAIDQRFTADEAFALPGYGSPAAVPPVKLDAVAVRSAPLGPVAGPQAPWVSFLRHALVRDGRVLVAWVRCSVRCTVSVSASDRMSGSSGRTTFTGTKLVGVARRVLGGRLTVSLQVGDGPMLSGHSRMRTPAPGPVPYTLYTHCGINWALIDGTYWRAAKPLSDGQGNPPPGWGNPTQRGTLTLIAPGMAQFQSPAGSVTFKRTPRTRPPFLCS
ncbi:MAG: hypothetical protein ACRDMJ_12925, partial [Solirubrobacteraceae bacterium]